MNKDRHKNDVDIIVHKYLKEDITTVTKKGDRMIMVKLNR